MRFDMLLRVSQNVRKDPAGENLQVKKRKLARRSTNFVNKAAGKIASKNGSEIVIRHLVNVSTVHALDQIATHPLNDQI